MELDMTKGNPSHLIFKFMVPVIMGNVFQQLYSIIDTVIVGQFIGVHALAAVGATGMISFLILGFMLGLTTGFTVLTSQRFGAGDQEGLKKSVGNAYVLCILITIVMTVISVAGMDWLLRVMRTPEDIFEMSKTYILIICWGMIFTTLYNILSSMLRAVGNSKVPLYFLIVAAVLNIILDLVLIIVFHMGVAGAAIATVVSQGVSGLLCLIYIIKKVPVLQIQIRHLSLDSYCVKNQLSVGIPMALQFSITAVGTIMIQVALNILGSTVVAAYTVASKIEALVTQTLGAIGVTMATYSAQNRGIGDLKRIKAGAKVALRIDVIYSVLAFAVSIALLPLLVKMFISEEVDMVLPYVRTYMIICGTCFIPLGMIYIYRNVIQGCGYGFLPMMGGVVELVCRGVAAFVAVQRMSYAGVCVGNASAWGVTGIYLWICYIFTMRKMEREQNLSKPDNTR